MKNTKFAFPAFTSTFLIGLIVAAVRTHDAAAENKENIASLITAQTTDHEGLMLVQKDVENMEEDIDEINVTLKEISKSQAEQTTAQTMMLDYLKRRDTP